MISVASGGTAARIAERILFNVVRAGSGTPARYSSMLVGAPFPFAAEVRIPTFAFFMGAMLPELLLQIHACDQRCRVMSPFDAAVGSTGAHGHNWKQSVFGRTIRRDVSAVMYRRPYAAIRRGRLKLVQI